MLDMILLEVHDGLFADTFELVPSPASGVGWRVLTPCDRDLPAGSTRDEVAACCPLLRDVSDLIGTDHFQDFHLLMQDIMRRAPSGQAWERLFDDKHLHEVGDVTVTRLSGKSERWKVFQFEKQRTLVRVLWSYGMGRKTLLLTHMFVKPGGKRKTPAAELDRARRTVERYLVAIDSDQAQLILEQGGRDGFSKLAR